MTDIYVPPVPTWAVDDPINFRIMTLSIEEMEELRALCMIGKVRLRGDSFGGATTISVIGPYGIRHVSQREIRYEIDFFRALIRNALEVPQPART